MSKRPYDSKKDPIEQVEALDRAQELFIPVHGHVLLYPEEIAVIDHPSFQRLRRVRQLGMAHMVFPGATHTRFEHSVGAVHVAQLIVNHINHNFRRRELTAEVGDWVCCGVDYPTARFIRLAALLHDIGHLPVGHTLEDELGHLRHHDGSERLSLVSERCYEQYEICRALKLDVGIERPAAGWSLRALVNAIYGPFAKRIAVPVEPFILLSHIVCKPPKGEDKVKIAQWDLIRQKIEESFDLSVCRDIVGNTICADFLDYLFRDWHHLGKSLYHDKRLYQYMEVRSHTRQGGTNDGPAKFVINIGPVEKIRHDALTDILELLDARYKLGETVLFHRTKLSLTGVLDRCLLEIWDLYQRLGVAEDRYKTALEDLLLESSDDGLVGVLKKLAAGATSEIKRKLQHSLKAERDDIEGQMGGSPELYPTVAGAGDSRGATGCTDRNGPETLAIGELQAQVNLIDRLIERLRDREVYTLGHKLRMSDFSGPHNSENPRVSKLLSLYEAPKHRLEFLRGIEALCGLPVGSTVMYSPHDARMNAKIAEVNLLVEGSVSAFDKYERDQQDSGLTRGALRAQVNRFYELWSAHVFVERSCWDRLPPSAQQNLQSVFKCFFFQMDPTADSKIAREQIECSVGAVRHEMLQPAFRAIFGNPPAVEKFKDFKFPSGLAFDIKH